MVVASPGMERVRGGGAGGHPPDVTQKSGHLIFMGRAGTAEFRNVMIKELPAPAGTLTAQGESSGVAISITHANVAG